MSLLWWILLNWFLLNLLIRSMEQFWRWGKDETALSRQALVGGMGGAILLVMYPRIISYVDIPLLQYSLSQSPTLRGVMAVAILLALFLFIFGKKPIVLWLGGVMVIIIAIILMGIWWWIATTLLYVLLTASSEEILKASTLKPLYPNLLSDLILFWICAGLGFAWFENMVYLLSLVLNAHGSEWLILQRYFSAVPLHAVWSWLIGFLLMKWWNKNPAFKVILGILWVIGFHAGYNYLLYMQTPLLIIPFLLGSYAGLAWLVLQVERVYVREGMESQVKV